VRVAGLGGLSGGSHALCSGGGAGPGVRGPGEGRWGGAQGSRPAVWVRVERAVAGGGGARGLRGGGGATMRFEWVCATGARAESDCGVGEGRWARRGRGARGAGTSQWGGSAAWAWAGGLSTERGDGGGAEELGWARGRAIGVDVVGRGGGAGGGRGPHGGGGVSRAVCFGFEKGGAGRGTGSRRRGEGVMCMPHADWDPPVCGGAAWSRSGVGGDGGGGGVGLFWGGAGGLGG